MRTRKPILGVTGPSGAGKSLFCSLFAEKGWLVLDCDEIYHRLISSGSSLSRKIASPEAFGPSVLSDDGSVDRRALADVVFAPDAEEKRKLLNRIAHRYVKLEIGRIMRETAESGIPGYVIDAPLLFEANMKKDCALTVALLAPRETRLRRLTERDRLPEDKLNMRLDSSPDDGFYVKRADVVIVNDGDPEKLKSGAETVEALLLTPGGRNDD